MADPTFFIIEDHDQEIRTLQETLLSLGLGQSLGFAKSAQSAREEIEAHRAELDLIFLDLSIPMSAEGSRIDNNVGYELLDWVHSDLNRQGARRIRVVVVSGQYDLTGIPDQKLRSAFEGTLVGIVQKDNLKAELGRVVAQLKSDPLLEELIRLQLLDIVPEYQTLFSSDSSTKDKSKAAKLIACRILTNDGDYRAKKVGICQFGDDLNGAIKQIIEKRFILVEGRRRVDKAKMEPNQKWGEFIWRGTMLEHLYGINNYRNRFEHLSQQPYIDESTQDEWQIPAKLATAFTRGNDVAEILRIQVKNLLTWYLPWHEQVYLPWRQSQKVSKEFVP